MKTLAEATQYCKENNITLLPQTPGGPSSFGSLYRTDTNEAEIRYATQYVPEAWSEVFLETKNLKELVEGKFEAFQAVILVSEIGSVIVRREGHPAHKALKDWKRANSTPEGRPKSLSVVMSPELIDLEKAVDVAAWEKGAELYTGDMEYYNAVKEVALNVERGPDPMIALLMALSGGGPLSGDDNPTTPAVH